MKSNIQKIGIILKPSHLEDLPNLVINLVRWLKRRDKEIYFSINEKSRFEKIFNSKKLKEISFVDNKFIFNEVELVLSLGGDGTLLGVCRNIRSSIPIFGVNIGRLGFITEFNKNDFYESLNVVLSGRFQIIKKHLFSLTVMNEGKKIQKEYFFNDAVFSKNEIARMFTLNVEAKGEHIFDLTGDGLIISSTYGSTAYSLAAGGPIVHPDVQAIILTPICPHSLTHRPLVIPDNYQLHVKVLEQIDTVNITLDGQTCVPFTRGATALLEKESRKSISLIKNSDRTYFHTLKEKFVHGRREIY